MQKVTPFGEVVRKLFPGSGGPINDVECPDQYVGMISDLQAQSRFHRAPVASRPPNQACVILVLESPHKDEYEGTRPIGPANGSTGRNIRRWLPEHVGLRSFGLILVNPIPFQCSLGEEQRLTTSKVFRAMWEAGEGSRFAERLKAIYSADDIVLNCCTKGIRRKGQVWLRTLVDHVITAHVPSGCIERWNHPAHWKTEMTGERKGPDTD